MTFSASDIANMTPDELAAAQEAVAAQRAAYEADAGKTIDEILAQGPTEEIADHLAKATEDGEETPVAADPEVWPHQTIEFRDQTLEVRAPGQEALVAVTVAGLGIMSPQQQMQIFSTFLARHLSPKSMVWSLMAMTDPDNPVRIEELITVLTKVAKPS